MIAVSIHNPVNVFEKMLKFFQVLGVLHITGTHTANGRHPQGHQIAIRLRAVALEISLERFLALRDGEFVGRLREVIHADVVVAHGSEALDGQLE